MLYRDCLNGNKKLLFYLPYAKICAYHFARAKWKRLFFVLSLCVKWRAVSASTEREERFRFSRWLQLSPAMSRLCILESLNGIYRGGQRWADAAEDGGKGKKMCSTRRVRSKRNYLLAGYYQELIIDNISIYTDHLWVFLYILNDWFLISDSHIIIVQNLCCRN